MKNTEIRIGNYVYRNDILVTVDEQTFWDMKNNPEQYKPVPLTEDWREKFGFEKTKFESSIKTLKYEWTSIYFNNGYVEISVSGHSCPVSIQHVHQLQNLYFSLTNQELKA
jgi:hypothetical protein